MNIVPVARAISLCESLIGYRDGKVDLYGIFNAIRPAPGYPHTQDRFCVFAQLINGMGRVPFHVDIRFAETDELTWCTSVKTLEFPDRKTVVQLALTIENCAFDKPGLYILELFCDNVWVCDTALMLH